ncbi:hypothetical protein D3P08_26495 [Paenibacillus nanensis]|uniref:Uncharacterized protein n=1 Tax=Paenibacillus nanensis TaxID=393251 RepID=A0A3A1UK55_9BACL|nr:hypothetical protein D3P08_26495 [Paenibacillus nanensis]
MNDRMKPLGQGNLKTFIREADEVKVFEVFGGDLPVYKANRKPTRKTIGRPIRQPCGGLSQSFICSRMSRMPPVGRARAEGLQFGKPHRSMEIKALRGSLSLSMRLPNMKCDNFIQACAAHKQASVGRVGKYTVNGGYFICVVL